MQIRTLLLTLISIFFFNLAVAQSTGKRVEQRVKNRAEYKVNNKIDRTVDKAVDDVFKGIFGKKKKKKTAEEKAPQSTTGSDDSSPDPKAVPQTGAGQVGMPATAPVKNWEPVKNETPLSFNMTLTTEKKGKPEVTKVSYTFDTWLLGMKFRPEGEEGDMLLILDNQKGTITSIVEKNGKREGYRMDRNLLPGVSADHTPSDVRINPTGNTKMIDGYFCREYLIESEDGTTNAWMTKELQGGFRQLFSGFNAPGRGINRMPNHKMAEYEQYGVMLESTSVMKNGKETIHTKITDLKTGNQIDRSILEIGEVELQDIGY